ncbi:MAG: radical SAM protein [archaeon]
MNEIVLINPRTGVDIGAGLSPPAALLSIAGELPGYRVRIIDQRVEPDWKGLVRKAISNSPLCVGITSFCGKQISNGLEISRFVKNIDRGVQIAWGGIHPTLFPEQTLRNSYVDFVIRGEGERTFAELARAIEKGHGFSGIAGLSYKAGNRPGHNKPRPFIDLDSLQPTPWHLVDTEKYIHRNMFIKGSRREMDIGMTSRGCAEGCRFCLNAVYNRGKWRAMSPAKTVQKIIRDAKMLHLDAVWLRDDNFFADLGRAEKISRELISRNANVRWYTSGIRIDTFNRMPRTLIKLIKQSGCSSFRFGVESGSQRMLDMIGKKISVSDVLSANRKAGEHGVIPYYSFMCGIPTETREDILRTVRLTKRLKAENPNAKIAEFTLYIPLPETELLAVCIKKGLRMPDSLEEWGRIDHAKSIGIAKMPYLKKHDLRYISNVLNTSLIVSDMVWDILPPGYRAALYPMKKWAEFRWNRLWFRYAPEINMWTGLSGRFLEN